MQHSVWGPVGWAVGFVLALGVMLMYGAGGSVNNDFTQNVWLPSRLVLNGIDPYNPAPAQVSAALGSYASQFQGFNSGDTFHFIYPMWVALLFTPLALLPLTVALALWRAFNLLLLFWGVVRILKSSRAAFRVVRAPAIAAIVLTAFLALIYRESLLTLFLGQFSIIEFALLAAIWGYLVSGPSPMQPATGKRVLMAGEVLVGMALAVLATKPQAVGLPVILLGLWAISRRRWAIPVSAVGTLALLLFVPLLAHPSSLVDWIGIVTSGQAGSQASVSASVWGVSYQALSGSFPWAWVALALTLVGLATLVPHWRRDLTDRTAPAPMSLALTLCVGLVISPYMLGYEHVLLLFTALLMLAAAGLPDERGGRNGKLWRMAVYAWMAALPFLIVALQVGLSSMEYPVIVQSLTMLALVYVARFKWKSAVGEA
ncbi:MAG: glycosyltransferase family 87 protein [Chloroflexota bacterium]